MTVTPGYPHLHLAAGDDIKLVARFTRIYNHIAGVVSLVGEFAGEHFDHTVIQIVEKRKLPKIMRFDFRLIAGQRDPDRAFFTHDDFAPVNAIRPGFQLYPGQEPEKPARGDADHLWDGFGSSGKLTRSSRTQALLGSGAGYIDCH